MSAPLRNYRAGLNRLPGEGLLGPGGKLRHGHVELALERDHDVARVLREALDGIERRHDEALRGGEHGHDGELGGAAVVELDVEAALLRLGIVINEEVERVVEVEEELRALAHERRVVARDSARLGVVRDLSRDLAVRLEHADEGEDLELADHRDVVPLLLRGDVLDVAAVRHGRVGALDGVKRLHAEAEERGHGDAAVLDLGVAKVADGLLVREGPERHLGAAKRVPEAEAGAEGVAVRLGELSELLLGGHGEGRGLGGARGDRGAHEGRSRPEGEGENNSGELHG
mmetsp:Transcript_5646/g.35049  ORF Transcript_5646/g.35049 Transcript_5646/m.35049 type:complete len:287 (-) Transcript_5646:27-887(-)